jgi:hypothetical protein
MARQKRSSNKASERAVAIWRGPGIGAEFFGGFDADAQAAEAEGKKS